MENKARQLMTLTTRILLIGFLIFLLYICFSLFWPRFLYQEGLTQLNIDNYDNALRYFERARKKIPGLLERNYARPDMFRIYMHSGQAFYHKGIQDWKDGGPSIKNYTLLLKGKNYLSKADAIFSFSYHNTYWLTLTEVALEKLHQVLFPKLKNPYNANVFYLKIFPLRPSGGAIRYAYIRYLNFKKRYNEIPAYVKRLMAIYPSGYFQLKKEPFYSKNLISNVKKGLTIALESGIQSGISAKALSDLHEHEEDYPKAASYYCMHLKLEPTAKRGQSYIHLGRLYLKQGKEEQAFGSFEKGLRMQGDTTAKVNLIYRILKEEKRQEIFFSFLSWVRQRGLRLPEADMILVQVYMEMKQYDSAKGILTRVIAANSNVQAYALLGVISRIQKDWDQMELFAQKTVYLDKGNSAYYYNLAESLLHQKKYKRAEEEITSAIQYAPKENPLYFGFRANIRWAQAKYALAVSDWEHALKLKPDKSYYAYRIALGYEKLAEFEKALTYIERAVSLDSKSEYKDIEKRLLRHQR